MKHHVVPHTVCSAAIVENATVTNVNEQTLNMERRSEDEIFIEGNARVIQSDLVATNGVVHLIDEVLIPPTSSPITEVLQRHNVSKFRQLVESVGLHEEFDNYGNVTVFAPFNEAFEEPHAAKYLEEARNDREKLKELVLYHVVNGKMESCDMERSRVLETKSHGRTLPLKVPLLVHPLEFS